MFALVITRNICFSACTISLCKNRTCSTNFAMLHWVTKLRTFFTVYAHLLTYFYTHPHIYYAHIDWCFYLIFTFKISLGWSHAQTGTSFFSLFLKNFTPFSPFQFLELVLHFLVFVIKRWKLLTFFVRPVINTIFTEFVINSFLSLFLTKKFNIQSSEVGGVVKAAFPRCESCLHEAAVLLQ